MCHIILQQQLELQLMETALLFRSISLVVAGSQDFHQELHLNITKHMIYKSKNPVFSSLASSDKSMEQYMKQSRKQSLGVWTTEVEIIAAASLLNATIMYMVNVVIHISG